MPHLDRLHSATFPLLAWATVCVAIFALFPPSADAQVFVYPQRPTQSNVQYFDFDWHHKDIAIGENADPDSTASLSSNPFGDRSTMETLAESFPRVDDDTPGHSQSLLGSPYHHGIADYQRAAPPPRAFTDFPDPSEDTGTERPGPSFDVDDDEIPEEVFQPSDLGDKTGGVRLFFYERERDIAERAAAFIDYSYRELVDVFRFVPSITLPYILYSSYQEFLQTNIFPVQEGVLGVTGRQELELVLPYFGDHRLFQHISTHEMVHQFQIQKGREVVEAAGLSGDPMDHMPLWFIEGMAEFYALDGLDAETEMLTRDLLLNPDPTEGFVMLDFFEDRPFSQLWTYKIGQARVTFLEDFYGEGTIQEVFERSHLLVGTRDGGPALSFRSLLVEITEDPARKISANFESWLKHRAYTGYLDSEHDAPNFDFFNESRGIMQTMTSSPDGRLLMYRSIQRNTGQVRLYVVDATDPDNDARVASDGRPGIESLHPVGPRNFDLHDDRLVFFARAGGEDILYLQDIDDRSDGPDLGSRTDYDLGAHDVLTAESPAFSPGGDRIAFIGLDEDGQKDLYVFEDLHDDDFIVTRITDDPHAPRGLTWGDEGVVFTSDATGHGRYNLFRVDIARGKGEVERLTFEERDHFQPHVTADGRLFFSAYDEARANVYEWTEVGIMPRTDVVTGLFDVTSAPNGNLWASYHYRGRRQIVRVPEEVFLNAEATAEEDEREVKPYPTLSLDGAQRYRATDLRNWQLSNLFGVLGASSSGIFGQLMLLTNDRLRNHALFLNVLAFGDFENTMADLFYLNQSSRLIWGTGLFQDVRYRIDRTFDDDDVPLFLAGERFYGARGTLRYPFNRFSFIQADLAIGGATSFLTDGWERELREEGPDNIVEEWEQIHDDHRFQTSPSLSLGYNTLRLHPGTGPIDGASAMLSGTLDLQPFDGQAHGKARLDAERYFPIYDRINISLRTGIGSTFGGELRRQFFLSSFDTLRGVDFGDLNYLLGNQFLFTKLELRFPLNFLVRIPLIDVEGLVGADFGGAGQDPGDVWDSRAFSPVTGFNFGLGPLVFRLHFALPIDIGAVHPLPRDGDWITNFSLGWRYW